MTRVVIRVQFYDDWDLEGVFLCFLLRDRGSRRGLATIYFIRTEDRPQKSDNGQLVLSVQGFLCQLKSLNKSIYLYFERYDISDWNVTIWLIGEHSAMEKINWLSCVTVFLQGHWLSREWTPIHWNMNNANKHYNNKSAYMYMLTFQQPVFQHLVNFHLFLGVIWDMS